MCCFPIWDLPSYLLWWIQNGHKFIAGFPSSVDRCLFPFHLNLDWLWDLLLTIGVAEVIWNHLQAQSSRHHISSSFALLEHFNIMWRILGSPDGGKCQHQWQDIWMGPLYTIQAQLSFQVTVVIWVTPDETRTRSSQNGWSTNHEETRCQLLYLRH